MDWIVNENPIAGICGFGDTAGGACRDLPAGHGVNERKAQTQPVFRLAYLSFVGAMVSTPVHLLTDVQLARWVVYGLSAAAMVFLAAGMMRRP